jgi:Na+:H+ antiporter
MIPRGVVGLIFANLGLGLTLHGASILDATTYATIVLMVMATTLVTPPLLKRSLRRRHATAAGASLGVALPPM